MFLPPQVKGGASSLTCATAAGLRALGIRASGPEEAGQKPCPVKAGSAKRLRAKQGTVVDFSLSLFFLFSPTLGGNQGVPATQVELRLWKERKRLPAPPTSYRHHPQHKSVSTTLTGPGTLQSPVPRGKGKKPRTDMDKWPAPKASRLWARGYLGSHPAGLQPGG